MAHTRRDVHPTFGYITVNLVELGERLGNPPIRPPELLKELEKLHIRFHLYDLVRVARQCIGMPYRRNAKRNARPRTFDCSTLMVYIFAHAGLNLPRFTHLMVNQGMTVEAPYQPGDLLFTTGKGAWSHSQYPNGISHVAMVTGHSTCVHTDNTNTKRVIEMPIEQLQWPIAVAKRMLPSVEECGVALLPSPLLSEISQPDALEGFIRKHLQATYRPRSS